MRSWSVYKRTKNDSSKETKDARLEEIKKVILEKLLLSTILVEEDDDCMVVDYSDRINKPAGLARPSNRVDHSFDEILDDNIEYDNEEGKSSTGQENFQDCMGT